MPDREQQPNASDNAAEAGPVAASSAAQEHSGSPFVACPAASLALPYRDATPDDAPTVYPPLEQIAWAVGYNVARAELLAQLDEADNAR